MKKYSDYFYKKNNKDELEGGAALTPETEEPLTADEVLEPAAVDFSQMDAKDEAQESAMFSLPAEPTFAAYQQEPAAAPDTPTFTTTAYPAPASASEEYAVTAAVPAEKTIISPNAIINGEMTVNGDIQMLGKIKGNITATGDMEVAGKVFGNITGNDIELNACEVKGDVVSTGFVYMDKESVMIGNLGAQDVTIDGKIKGNITAERKLYVRSNSLIVGNVKASTLAIDEGAALQGQVLISNKNTPEVQLEENS